MFRIYVLWSSNRLTRLCQEQAIKFRVPVLGHVPGHMLEHVLKHMPDSHVLDRHVPEHVLARHVLGL